MAMMVDEKEDVLAGLRRRIEECEAESKRLKELAEDREREARALRVRAAKEEHQREITPPPPPLGVRIRNYAMGTDTFTEDEIAADLGVSKVKLHGLLAGLVDDGLLARSQRGRLSIYALLAPDPDRAARPRHETPENLVAFEERKRGAVAGSGRAKLSGRKDVDRLARAARKAGATVTKQGNGHIKMVKDGEKVTMSSTPRASGMSKTKKELNDLGIAV